MEMEIQDPEMLFKLLKGRHDEYVSLADLVNGVKRLRGAARSIDLVALMHKLKHFQDIQEDSRRFMADAHEATLNSLDRTFDGVQDVRSTARRQELKLSDLQGEASYAWPPACNNL